MVLLVLLPYAVPLLGVLGLVCLGLVFHGKLALDDLEPDLAGLSIDLGRVELDLAQLVCVVDLEEDVAHIFVREVVANALEFADVLDARRGGELHQGLDTHLGELNRGDGGVDWMWL